ncbi:unnamed protein product [Onchocerca flexuosa]|uniref:SAM domain-containing protein n=1 Tax=Onchocerca flexuosa TaxID=387005 RepID=A0A183I4N0_9BILA|nr:unnamed protein product [Onchocerca flexuosa]
MRKISMDFDDCCWWESLFRIFKVDVAAISILDDYTVCKENGFGRALLLCDVDDALTVPTQQKLISLLNDLQRKDFLL